jgi:flagellar assembly factor FliW
MGTIHFRGTDLAFNDSDIIAFDEGLIGLTHLKRMVLIRQTEIEPFIWLASPDDDQFAFLVVPPEVVVPGIEIPVTDELRASIELGNDESPTVLAISRIAAVWNESTVNLLSPIAISPKAMKGMQFIVNGSSYGAEYPMGEDRE